MLFFKKICERISKSLSCAKKRKFPLFEFLKKWEHIESNYPILSQDTYHNYSSLYYFLL